MCFDGRLHCLLVHGVIIVFVCPLGVILLVQVASVELVILCIASEATVVLLPLRTI